MLVVCRSVGGPITQVRPCERGLLNKRMDVKGVIPEDSHAEMAQKPEIGVSSSGACWRRRLMSFGRSGKQVSHLNGLEER